MSLTTVVFGTVHAAPIAVSFKGTVTDVWTITQTPPSWAQVGAPVAGKLYFDADLVTTYGAVESQQRYYWYGDDRLPAELTIGTHAVAGLFGDEVVVVANQRLDNSNQYQDAS